MTPQEEALTLAAHAPSDIPWWFKPQMQSPKPDWPKDAMGANFQVKPDAELTPEQKAALQAINDWERDFSKQRLIQWPWAYAELVLAARPPEFSP